MTNEFCYYYHCIHDHFKCGKKYCIQQEPECIMIIIIDIIVIIKRAYINMTTFTQVEQKQSE